MADTERDRHAESVAGRIWSCKIGRAPDEGLPLWADGPMRQAVANAYKELTGEEPEFIFSGWGGELDVIEQSVVQRIDGTESA